MPPTPNHCSHVALYYFRTAERREAANGHKRDVRSRELRGMADEMSHLSKEYALYWYERVGR